MLSQNVTPVVSSWVLNRSRSVGIHTSVVTSPPMNTLTDLWLTLNTLKGTFRDFSGLIVVAVHPIYSRWRFRKTEPDFATTRWWNVMKMIRGVSLFIVQLCVTPDLKPLHGKTSGGWTAPMVEYRQLWQIGVGLT